MDGISLGAHSNDQVFTRADSHCRGGHRIQLTEASLPTRTFRADVSHHTQAVSLEGFPCLGKTTLIRALAEQGFHCTAEIPDTRKARYIEFPSELPVRAHPRYADEWYLQLELRRFDLWSKHVDWQFLDRCVYTQVAYIYANDRLRGTSELPYLLHRLLELEREERRILPAMILFTSEVEFSWKRIFDRNRGDERDRIAVEGPPYGARFMKYYGAAFYKIAAVLGESALVVRIPEQQDGLVERVSKWIGSRQAFSIPPVGALAKAFDVEEELAKTMIAHEPEMYWEAVTLAKKNL